MKVAVVGSRSFTDYSLLAAHLDSLENVELIVSGGAQGADKLAEKWAEEHYIKTQIFLPDWEEHGKAAGIIRNRNIVQNAELVLAFWDGISNGTKYSIDFAKKCGIDVQIIYFEERHE